MLVLSGARRATVLGSGAAAAASLSAATRAVRVGPTRSRIDGRPRQHHAQLAVRAEVDWRRRWDAMLVAVLMQAWVGIK